MWCKKDEGTEGLNFAYGSQVILAELASLWRASAEYN
jgi:hypothetical protein